MAEFIHTKETIVKEGEPIVFENKTKSNFDVAAGVVFHKSGLYRVTVDGNRTIVSKESEIIHCHECEYGEIDDRINQYYCKYSEFWNNGDHFCGYAERRGNNGSE